MKWTITRENNKYNKSMKWHLMGESELGKMSKWYKTQKEAEYAIHYYDIIVPEKYRTVNN